MTVPEDSMYWQYPGIVHPKERSTEQTRLENISGGETELLSTTKC